MRRLIEPFHLDLCCLQKPIIIACGSERVSKIHLFKFSKMFILLWLWNEPGHSISYQTACAPSEDSEQSVHSCCLIRVFTRHSVGSLGSNVSSGGQRRLWSDFADAQVSLSLRWSHVHYCRKCCVPTEISSIQYRLKKNQNIFTHKNN